MGEQPKYRELEHTGDLAIEVTAATREELFAHSLVALARLMVEEDGIAAAERREIRVRFRMARSSRRSQANNTIRGDINFSKR